MKIRDILLRGRGFAFEFFPPKTLQGEQSLFENLKRLESINPAYVSVTYGAGGANRENTQRIVCRMAAQENLTTMAHLTCVGHTKAEIDEILSGYLNCGIENIMALRGDIPKGSNISFEDGDFLHAINLIQYIRQNFDDHFSIGGAAFPEGHPESPDLETDIERFKDKVDAGLDFAVTQMFFDNSYYYRLIERAQHHGIEIPIIPGIMPFTNYNQITKFAELSQATIPPDLMKRLQKAQHDQNDVYKIGVDYAIQQCDDLMNNGFHFLHFFTLNKSNASLEIVKALKSKLRN